MAWIKMGDAAGGVTGVFGAWAAKDGAEAREKHTATRRALWKACRARRPRWKGLAAYCGR
eukprot:871333-Prymnesium_polylepis.1